MILRRQSNIAAFAGSHRYHWPGQQYTRSAISALVSAVASLNLRIKCGPTVLLLSGAVAIPTTGVDVPWKIEGEFVVRSIGASANFAANGEADNGQTRKLLGNAGTVTIDTTVSNDVKGSAQWGVANAANILKVQTGTIKRVE